MASRLVTGEDARAPLDGGAVALSRCGREGRDTRTDDGASRERASVVTRRRPAGFAGQAVGADLDLRGGGARPRPRQCRGYKGQVAREKSRPRGSEIDFQQSDANLPDCRGRKQRGILTIVFYQKTRSGQEKFCHFSHQCRIALNRSVGDRGEVLLMVSTLYADRRRWSKMVKRFAHFLGHCLIYAAPCG